jgi:hypothetical protein
MVARVQLNRLGVELGGLGKVLGGESLVGLGLERGGLAR